MKRRIPREVLDDRLGLGISGSRKLQRRPGNRNLAGRRCSRARD
jgi:hypothetical protein